MGKRVGLLTGLLVLAMASGVLGQSPSPPPWFGGARAEMPAHGIAVTVPDGWVAFDVTGDVDDQVGRAAVVLDLDAFEASTESIAEALHLLQQQGVQLTVMDPARQSSCQLGVSPVDVPDLDLVAAAMHADLSNEGATTHIEVPEVVELPAGPTRRINVGDSGGSETAFYVGNGASTFVVVCVGRERPDDDWLSIVETIEFLPEAE